MLDTPKKEPWPLRDYSEVFEERATMLHKLRALGWPNDWDERYDDMTLEDYDYVSGLLDTWQSKYGDYYEDYATPTPRQLVSNDRIDGALMFYRTRPGLFIKHWGVVHEPRIADDNDALTILPFIPFEKQLELITFLYDCLSSRENGLIEKSRDMGATWTCAWFSIWLWLFWPGAVVGWGSKGADEVDQINNPNSIFEKIRIGLRNLPEIFLPPGFNFKLHCSFMRITNPATSAAIIGDVGDNIGRGGRSLIYFKDEAQPLDAKILTPTGWQTMGDMRCGSRVIGPNGLPRRVTQVKNCGVYDVYRMTLGDGSQVECSPGHLWTVNRVYGKHETVMKTTEELAADLTYYPSGVKNPVYKYRLPTTAPIVFDQQQTLPLDPYIVGVLLGDGTVVNVPAECPRLSSADQEIVDEVARLLPKGCIITGGVDEGKTCGSYRLVDERDQSECNRWSKSRARQAVVASGIAGHNSYTKFVPDAYKFSSPAQRLALLQGLMDTDGSSSGATLYFGVTSKRLAEDVRFIVQSLGGVATYREYDHNDEGYATNHALHIAMPDNLCPFRLPRKIATMYRRKHPIDRAIVLIEKVRRAPVRCISVDADDGLYLTDNCVVTHNSAHYVHPELVEAALSANTNVQIDLSSVHGVGNVFHRKREGGVEWYKGVKDLPKKRTRVFVMDWRDHPGKDEEWYELHRADYERNGLLHIWAQEVDRDYSASVEGVIIKAAWVKAAIDAHVKLRLSPSGLHGAGLDVADDGGDTNAMSIRRGFLLEECDEWSARDPGVTTRNVIAGVTEILPLDLQYDCVGLGVTVKSEYNRLKDERKVPRGLQLIPWNAGAEPLFKDKPIIPHDKRSPLNGDYFANLKAQAWFMLARRFENTYRALHESDFTWTPDQIISLSSTIPKLQKLVKELSQPTASRSSNLKMMVNKKPPGTKSTNMADSVVMNFWPVNQRGKLHISQETLQKASVPNTLRLNALLQRLEQSRRRR
jgi:LAGLIDADG-like domain